MNRSSWGIISGLAAASIWGGMYVVSKVLLDVIPPFALITCRLLLGSLTLAFILAWQGRLKSLAVDFWPVLGVGIIGYGISLGLQFIGTKLSTAANASLVTSATPAFVLPIAAWVLNERITPARVLALIVSSAGVVAVIDPRMSSLNPDLMWGNAALVGAALTWALYSVLIRRVTREADVLPVSLVAFLGGLPISVPGGSLELATIGMGRIDSGVILGVLFLGIIATAGAMYLWNKAFALVEAGRVSLTFFAQPVVGTVLSWLFLHEAITPLFVVGAVLIALGLLLASR